MECKSNFVSRRVVLGATMEQVLISGEDNYNNGHDQFLSRKNVGSFLFCIEKNVGNFLSV